MIPALTRNHNLLRCLTQEPRGVAARIGDPVFILAPAGSGKTKTTSTGINTTHANIAIIGEVDDGAPLSRRLIGE